MSTIIIQGLKGNKIITQGYNASDAVLRDLFWTAEQPISKWSHTLAIKWDIGKPESKYTLGAPQE